MKRRVGIVLWLIVVAVAVASGIDLSAQARRFVESMQSQGDIGLIYLALAYIPASLLFVPAALLTLTAGFSFGGVKAVIAVSLGSTLGATAAFLAGRTLLRQLIEHKVAADARFQALDAAVAEHGFKIVTLTRLSPVLPSNLLNYAFGLTKLRVREFVLATWVGALPTTVAYLTIGSAARNLSDIYEGRSAGSVAEELLFGVGLIATLIVTLLVARIAKKALTHATANTHPAEI